jgi:hypothetical protein
MQSTHTSQPSRSFRRRQVYEMLGDAYTTVGGHDNAIELYWRGLEEGNLPPSGTLGGENPVIKAFKAAGDKDGLARFYETAIERNE